MSGRTNYLFLGYMRSLKLLANLMRKFRSFNSKIAIDLTLEKNPQIHADK